MRSSGLNLVPWLLGLILSLGFVFLGFFSDSDSSALYERWKAHWIADPTLSLELATHCNGEMRADSASPLEQYFVAAFVAPPFRPEASCRVRVREVKAKRLFFERRSVFVSELVLGDRILWEQSAAVRVPHAIVFFPLLVFILGIVLGLPVRVSVVYGVLVATLAGISVATLSQLVPIALSQGFWADKNYLSLLFFGLWFELWRVPLPRVPGRPKSKWIPLFLRRKKTVRWIFGLMGFWYPYLHALSGRTLEWRGNGGQDAQRPVARFLEWSALIAMGSLYLMGLGYGKGAFVQLWSNLELPRTLALVTALSAALNYWIPTLMASADDEPAQERFRLRAFSGTPRIGRLLLALLACEAVCYGFGIGSRVPLFLRWSLVCLGTEMFPLSRWQTFHRLRLLRFAATFIGPAFMVGLCQHAGLTTVWTFMTRPWVHPHLLAAMSFLSATGLGFLSGSFAVAFFGLAEFMHGSLSTPSVHAALLDGSVVGALLSPFSFFNTYGAYCLHRHVGFVVRLRLRQLGVPLLMSFLLYILSALTAIRLLEPVLLAFGIVAFLTWKFVALARGPGATLPVKSEKELLFPKAEAGTRSLRKTKL